MELAREDLDVHPAYARLFEGDRPPTPVEDRSIAWFLRHSVGLSAWKAFRGAKWPLRVNPSSGNLHPTETYVVDRGRVCHYAPREHALEQRTVLALETWESFFEGREGFLVALTSIQWREAWKYGERAFRYCQHDIGHAIAALRFSAALLGWTMRLLPEWSDEQVAGLLGVDREADRGVAEQEEPECIAVVAAPPSWKGGDPAVLVEAAREASWLGAANQLSPDRVDWPIIERVVRAARYPGVPALDAEHLSIAQSPLPPERSGVGRLVSWAYPGASEVILRRRSAVAFDARSSLSRERLFGMLSRLQPGGPPWDAIDWPPHVHLAIFVHRVDGLTPGIYAFLRDAVTAAEWRAAMRPEFLWEKAPGDPSDRLFLLLPTDVTWAAKRVSCDQDIAGDGFFSLGMIARFEAPVLERGEWFYRRLFWECGMIGQVLYLEAEAAGARGTGIGCFYDDPVHEVLGLTGSRWQSLYHFSMGAPVDDSRLTTEPGYPWEKEPIREP